MKNSNDIHGSDTGMNEGNSSTSNTTADSKEKSTKKDRDHIPYNTSNYVSGDSAQSSSGHKFKK